MQLGSKYWAEIVVPGIRTFSRRRISIPFPGAPITFGRIRHDAFFPLSCRVSSVQGPTMKTSIVALLTLVITAAARAQEPQPTKEPPPAKEAQAAQPDRPAQEARPADAAPPRRG